MTDLGVFADTKLNKFDILVLNNGWNEKNEKLIASIGENSEVYKWMHDKASHRYNLLNRLIGIVIVILNAVLSAQTTLTGVGSCETSSLFQKILIYIVTILAVINNFLRYQELSTHHKNASGHFSEIKHDVQQQMCNYRKDRENAVKYIQQTLKKYDSLISNSPSIPEYILKKLHHKIKNTDISMPDRMQKIDITQEEENVDRQSAFNVAHYNPLNIQGDIQENDIEALQDYLQRNPSNYAALKFQYDRILQS